MRFVQRYIVFLIFLLPICAALTAQEIDQDEEVEPTNVEELLVNEAPGQEQLPEATLDQNNELIFHNNPAYQDFDEQKDVDDINQVVATSDAELLAIESALLEQAPLETGPDVTARQAKPRQKQKQAKIKPVSTTKPLRWVDEGNEPQAESMAQLNLLTDKDISFHIGGRLKDEAFVYHNVHTLRSDYHDENTFIRHKLNLDLLINQGEKQYGRPASQGCVRLTNYVFWQDEANYMPITIDEINLTNEDPTLSSENLTLAKDVKVKTLVPLLFVEQAWFKLNLDTFTDTFNNHPTFLKVGYFPYTVGRGVAMGFHEDLAVDYLGWGGEGGFTRFPFMPPGVLFRTNFWDNLSWDVYFNLWRETNAGLADTLKPERWSRLTGPRPERGSGKDRITLSTKLDFTKSYKDFGTLQLEPYAIYVTAPEQTIELAADASAELYTYGIMADLHRNGWSINVELAGQCGAQRVHALDRNEVQVTRSSADGGLRAALSHVFVDSSTGGLSAKTSEDQAHQLSTTTAVFEPDKMSEFIVNLPENKDLNLMPKQDVTGHMPSTQITKDGTRVQINPGTQSIFNANTFGSARFRNPYKLSYQGFMALADLSYTWDKHPFKLAGAAGYISGDNYPYNEEVSRTFKGFIPLRSRYKGMGVSSFLIFDRLVIPRPLNIANRTLYAFNDQKDLSNLQFLGLGLTWYPLTERAKMSVTTDVMLLWEAAQLNKWDKNGKHPDATIEAQLSRLRNTVNGTPTLFSGWEANTPASRMLGTEVDIKILYHPLDHCDFVMRGVLFFPGNLYRDLDGQPNALTRRVDELGFTRFDSLGSQVAFAFVAGLNYRF